MTDPSWMDDDETLAETIEACLSGLPPLEAEIVSLYFGLGDLDPLTLGEIAARTGLARDDVLKLKNQGLQRLRGRDGDEGGGAGRPAPLPPTRPGPLSAGGRLQAVEREDTH